MTHSAWPSVTIESLIASGAITGHKDGNHGSQYPKAEEFGAIGVPFLTAKSLSGGRADIEGAPRLAENNANKLRLGFVRPGDVLLSHNATVGRVAVVPEFTGRLLIGTSLTYFRLDTEKISPRYFAAFLAGTDFQNQLSAAMSQTTRNQVPITAQRRLQVLVPPLAEQKSIASILCALDDKIELNRRMNGTLEAMARTLFQSWFVDFDPVRSKLNGNHPAGLDESVAELFPNSFQESLLGPIPRGWIAGNFGSVIAASRERVGGESGATVLSAVSSSELVLSDEHFRKQVYSESIHNYLKVRIWDFAYNPSRINIGSIGMLKNNFIGAVSPVYEVFRSANEYHWYVERAIAHVNTQNKIQSLCSGSVRQSLKLKDLESISLVVPPVSIVHAFNKIWEQWHGLIQANENESKALAVLRDTLLPKLLSGEVDTSGLQRKKERTDA